MALSQQQKQKIADALTKAGVSQPCTRCGNHNHQVLDGYVALSTQDNIGDVVLGGTNVPCAAVACSRCGAVTLHALGALGLLPQGK